MVGFEENEQTCMHICEYSYLVPIYSNISNIYIYLWFNIKSQYIPVVLQVLTLIGYSSVPSAYFHKIIQGVLVARNHQPVNMYIYIYNTYVYIIHIYIIHIYIYIYIYVLYIYIYHIYMYVCVCVDTSRI